MVNQIQKKKRKKKRKLLLVDYSCLDRESLVQTLREIQARLRRIFTLHISEENAISPYDLFEEVMGVDPDSIDIYKVNYWWNVLKSVLRQMRSSSELFIINKRTKLFVLQTQEEANYYKKMINRDIVGLKKSKVRADEWVKGKKWRNI